MIDQLSVQATTPSVQLDPDEAIEDCIVAALAAKATSPQPVQSYAGEVFDGLSDVLLLQASVEAAEVGAVRIGTRLNVLEDERKSVPTTIMRHADGDPWTYFDGSKVAFLVALAVLALFVSVNTLATALLASGRPEFDDPVRTYLFSMLPLLGCAGLKFLELPRVSKKTVDTGIMVVGIAAAFVWCALFAVTFPLFESAAADPFARFTAPIGGSGAASTGIQTGPWLVLVGLLGEMFLAAAAWRTIDEIVALHSVTTCDITDEAQTLDEAIDEVGKEFASAVLELGEARAELAKREHQRAIFVEGAVNEFTRRKELQAYQQQREASASASPAAVRAISFLNFNGQQAPKG